MSSGLPLYALTALLAAGGFIAAFAIAHSGSAAGSRAPLGTVRIVSSPSPPRIRTLSNKVAALPVMVTHTVHVSPPPVAAVTPPAPPPPAHTTTQQVTTIIPPPQ